MKKRVLVRHHRIFPPCGLEKNHRLSYSEELPGLLLKELFSSSWILVGFDTILRQWQVPIPRFCTTFDNRRRDFAPYGFTCEIWEPRQMPRPDRHDEIEINFLDRGTLTYLIGGQRVVVHPRQVTAFWAAVPHQVIAFDNVNFYYVVTVPFGWVLQWGLPESLLTALTQGQIVADTNPARSALDCQMFDQWHKDIASRPGEHEIVVLELHARLLRLADSVVARWALIGCIRCECSLAQQTNLDKAELMACFVAQLHVTDSSEGHCLLRRTPSRLRGDALPKDFWHDTEFANYTSPRRACPTAIDYDERTSR